MKDPSRLLSQTGSLEAQLLEAVRDIDPPPNARDEVWRRLASSNAAIDSGFKKVSPFAAWASRLSARRRERAVAAGAGAATWAAAAPLAAQTALGAGTKALAQTGWLSAVKWVAVVGTLAPAAGIGVHWVVTSRLTAAVAPSLPSSPPPVASARAPIAPLAPPAPTSAVLVAPDQAPSPPTLAPRRGPASSNLDAESTLLRSARERLENGDPKGSLDDIASMANRFPRGELAQEREVVAIQALLALGQHAAAATRTAAFLRTHPSSPYADSLRQALKP